MKIDVLGVKFDNLTMDEACERACALMDERKGAYIVTPNPEIVMLCRKDGKTAQAVEKADLVIPDGIGVVKGAKLLGTPLKEKIPGIDLTCRIFEVLAKRGGSVFLFGAKPGVAEQAGRTIAERYPGLVVCGTNDGYFSDDTNIVNKINEARPDFLLVCLGMAKQEQWMADRSGVVDAGLMIGAGGSLDVFAGTVQRAPAGFQKLGLEWFYRLCKEPKRIGRMAQLPRFVFAVLGKRLGGRS